MELIAAYQGVTCFLTPTTVTRLVNRPTAPSVDTNHLINYVRPMLCATRPNRWLRLMQSFILGSKKPYALRGVPWSVRKPGQSPLKQAC